MPNRAKKSQDSSLSGDAVSDTEVLGLYKKIVPLLSRNPEDIKIESVINAWLLTVVWYDFYHYLMEDPWVDEKPQRFVTKMNRYITYDTESSIIAIGQTPSEDPNTAFDRMVEENYQAMLAQHKAEHPNSRECDYYRIESHDHPRIVIGFFRRRIDTRYEDFSEAEKKKFELLAPDLFHLYRAVLTQLTYSQSFQYFNSFAEIGSRISDDYGLSASELRLLPDILFGHSIEEIGAKHFISISTVKSHVQQILKKTGTKNRLDFIGRFFTSPERVQL